MIRGTSENLITSDGRVIPTTALLHVDKGSGPPRSLEPKRTLRTNYPKEFSRILVFRNIFSDVEYALRTCAGNGTRFEFECYDVGHLYNLAKVFSTVGWCSGLAALS